MIRDTRSKLVEDSDWSVAAWGQPGKFVVGYVDEVNGPGALAVPEFVPSQHELLILLKYWVKESVDTRLSWLLYEQVGSSETRLEAFASRRVNRIADVLGNEEMVQKAIDEVYEAYAKNTDPLAWRVFTGQASDEEKQRFKEEQENFLGGDDSESEAPAPSTTSTTDEGGA